MIKNDHPLLTGAHRPPEINSLRVSLGHLWSVLKPLLEASRPQLVVQIGTEPGPFCDALHQTCRRLAAKHIGINPNLDQNAIEQVEALGVEFCRDTSFEALQRLPRADVYIFDGDPGYYTVLNELTLVQEKFETDLSARGAPLIFIHDTGRPCGRRDFFTHAAIGENAAKSDMLKAIDDVRNLHPEWRLLNVPAAYGLGILYQPDQLHVETRGILHSIEAGLQTLGPVLATLEQNRYQLADQYLRLRLRQRVSQHPDMAPKQTLEPPASWLHFHRRKWLASKFVLKSFAALRPGCRPGRLKANQLLRAYASRRKSLGPQVEARPIACFDMFDTLVRRVCDPPDTVIREAMGFAWLVLARNGLDFDREVVLEARELATKNLRRKMEVAGVDPECNLREMLEATWDELSCPLELRGELTELVLAHELQCEIAHIVAMPGAKEMLQACKSSGQTTVVVSDIYLTGGELHHILTATGLAPYIDHIFSSADHRAGKYSGGLFRAVSEQLQVDFAQMSHLGDNIYSDYLAPNRLGVHGRWYLSFKELRRREQAAIRGERHGLNGQPLELSFRAQHEVRDERHLYELGNRVYGPMFLSYLRHIAEKSVQLGLTDIYFLARDGYGFVSLFKDVWNAMPAVRPFAMPKVHYLYLSRASSNVILASELATRGVEVALLKNPEMRVKDYLKFCDLNMAEAKDPTEFGLDPNTALEAVLGTQAFTSWTEALAESPELRKKSEHERWKLQEYLAQNGFFSQGSKAFVDVGWNGTIPHLLSQQFADRPDFPELHVLLLGRCKSNFSQSPKTAYRTHPGFLMDDRGFPFGGKIPSDVPPLVELAANAPYGSTVGYEVASHGKIKPVLDPAHAEEIRWGIAIREGWQDYIKAHLEATGIAVQNDKLRITAARGFLEFYRKPRRRYVRAISRCIFRLDWKTKGSFDLVGLRHGWRFYHRFLLGMIAPATWSFGAARRYWVPSFVVKLLASFQRSS